MNSIFKVLVVAGVFASSALAAPATTKTTSCAATYTTTASFDALSTGAAVPSGYAGANWNGLTVAEPVSNYDLNAKSKPYVAVGPAEGVSVTGTTGVLMTLDSFYFACVNYAYPGSGFFVPVPCSLQLISEAETTLVNIATSGPYAYTVNYTNIDNGYAGNMTKVTVNKSSGTFFFNLVSGASYTQLVLDSVVMTQQNSACQS